MSRIARQGRTSVNGFTMIELMIVVVVIAIGLALAIPSYEDLLNKRQTTSAAEQTAALMRAGRLEAVKRNQPMTVSYTRTNDTTWCVGMIVGDTACDCTITNTADASFCDVDNAEQRVTSATFPKAQLPAGGVAGTDFTFDPVRGILAAGDLANAHSLTFTSENGNYQLRSNVGATGRVEVCNSDSTKKVPGFDNC